MSGARIARLLDWSDFAASFLSALLAGVLIGSIWYYQFIPWAVDPQKVETALWITAGAYVTFVLGCFFRNWRVATVIGGLALLQFVVGPALGIVPFSQLVSVGIVVALPMIIPFLVLGTVDLMRAVRHP